jgi:deoxycytidine triphosphate deaminase
LSMINIGGQETTSKLSNVNYAEDVQPNAVDLRLGKVLKIKDNVFTIDEDQKVHRGSEEFEPWEDGYYYLYPGSYEVIMQNEIHVGPDEAGFVITRSTLNRNGLFLTSGLYDTGYEGVMAGVLHVNVGLARIKPGTRIGQYLNWKAEALSSYDGDYGKGKEHDQKYA